MNFQSRNGIWILLFHSLVVRVAALGLAGWLLQFGLSTEKALGHPMPPLLELSLATIQVAGFVATVGCGLWLLRLLYVAFLSIRVLFLRKQDSPSFLNPISELIHFPIGYLHGGEPAIETRTRSDVADFERWCKSNEPELSLSTIQTKTYFNSVFGNLSDRSRGAFFDANMAVIGNISRDLLPRILSKEHLIDLHIRASIHTQFFDLNLTDPPGHRIPKADNPSQLRNVTIGGISDVQIAGATIRQISISTSVGSVALSNCMIGTLTITPTALVDIELTGCWIGEFTIASNNSVNNLTISGGTIRSFNCPAPREENPIRGNVTISGEENWPTTKEYSILFKGTQSYRSLRSHLEELDNAPATMKIRVLELRSDRMENETGLIWFVGLIYDYFAQYGLSPARPLAILAVILAISTAGICTTDSAALGMDRDQYTGWRAALLSEPAGICSRIADLTGVSDCIGDLFSSKCSSSLTLSLQSSLNPFGFFSTRRLVVASTGFAHVLLMLQGLASYTLIAMTAFGIRKRFRLH